MAHKKNGKKLITPVFRKHAGEIGKVFADASPKELPSLETILKKDRQACQKPWDRNRTKDLKLPF
jgi:hypothetical protein